MKRRHQTTLYPESTVNRFSTIYNTVRLSELWSSNNHLTKLITLLQKWYIILGGRLPEKDPYKSSSSFP